MEQTDIYDFIGVNYDPVFNQIEQLEMGRTVELGEFIITLNQNGLYELESTNSHECFTTISQVYDSISRYLNLLIL